MSSAPENILRACRCRAVSVYSRAMKLLPVKALALILCSNVLVAHAAEPLPAVPRFSIEYMDRLVDPGVDFYRFAAGAWLKNNPVPADKSRWSGFEQLRERNWHLQIGRASCRERV